MNKIIDVYDLTPTQMGMFIQTSISSNAYCLQYVLRISKDADLDVLEKCLYYLSEKHLMLKSAFVRLKSSGNIKQVIVKDRFPHLDKVSFEKPFSQETLDNLVDVESRKGFNLLSDCLLRMLSVDFTDERFLVICAHHIIIDGWSITVLLRDIERIYSALEKQELYYCEVDKTVSTSFKEYSLWMKNAYGEKDLLYWKELFANCGRAATLPFCRNSCYHKSMITLDNGFSYKIEEYARSKKTSVNTVLESAFAILLLRYNHNAIFGKMFFGRSAPVPGIKDAVGPFINMLPVIVREGCNVLSEIQAQAVESIEHGYIALSDIYSHSDLKNNHIRVLFVFNNYVRGNIIPKDSRIGMQLVDFKEQTEFDLTVSVMKMDGIYHVWAVSVFSNNDNDILLSEYQNALKCVIDDSVLANHFHGTMPAPPAISQAVSNSEVEATICRMFEKVIGVKRVNPNDNYYDLGGTSLGMMELLSSELLEDLSPSVFMMHPTPAELADKLSTGEASSPIAKLYAPEDADSAIILFPYGGGDAAAYTALVAEFRRRRVPISLYFVPWGCDYDCVAAYLQSFPLPLWFYSHCAGAVIAMKLLDRLKNVDKFIAGASIPPEEMKNIWPSFSDEMLLSILRQAGMPVLPKSQEKNMLHQFRNNTNEYFEYLQGKTERTPIGVSVILSRKDVFTRSYSRATELWERCVDHVDSVQFIDSSSHYFQSINAPELTDILLYEV